MIDPMGGPREVQIAYRPPVAVGEGTVVQLGHGLYATVISAAWQRRRGAVGLYLTVDPVPTGCVLNGIGEYAVDVRPIEEVL